MSNKIKNKKLIEIKNIFKQFGDKKVLQDLSLDIFENQNLAILGGNGAGKTVLTEIIVGLNKVEKGTIEYFFDTKNWQNQLGIQFQDATFPKGIKVWEVVRFITGLYSFQENKEKLKELIQTFGIVEFYAKEASSLSGGEKQRLNLLLAIIHNPEVIILDEISTGLDVVLRKRIITYIKKFAIENKSSVILISHDFSEIDYLCDRFVILKNGKIDIDINREEINKQKTNVISFLEKQF